MNWIPNLKTVRLTILLLLLSGSCLLSANPPAWYGEFRAWQPLVLTPDGPQATASAEAASFYLLTNTFTLDWPVLARPSAPAARTAAAPAEVADDKRPVVLKPSPGSDAYQLMFQEAAERELYVNDSEGRRVDHAETTRQQYFLRTTDWPAGVYFLTVREDARRSVYRLEVNDPR